MKIAYLTSQYARASDTFIRREVQGLRELGHEVHTYSARRAPGQDVSEEVRREQANTMYLTEQPVKDLAKSTVKRLVKRPTRFMKAAKSALELGRPGVKNRVWQVAYVMEASLLAEDLEDKGVEHLHNHLAQASATVALLASEMSGIPYSMTVHGPHIFFEPREQALGPKSEPVRVHRVHHRVLQESDQDLHPLRRLGSPRDHPLRPRRDLPRSGVEPRPRHPPRW